MQDERRVAKPATWQASKQELWSGRSVAEGLPPQYYYQVISHGLEKLSEPITAETPAFAFLGYACDVGVARNQGRAGAAAGPDAIRQQLAKLPLHRSCQLLDLGNICPKLGQGLVEGGMEQAQADYAELGSAALASGRILLGLGGGHDLAFATGSAVLRHLQTMDSGKSLGIINFDAHFDIRPLENGRGTSGTPFYQLLENSQRDCRYLALGIQEHSNSPQLFALAAEKSVEYILSRDCSDGPEFEELAQKLSRFIRLHDHIYFSIDIDAFSLAYAPGVSATSPFGLEPRFASKALRWICREAGAKLLAFDIAELNPSYDVDSATAKLCARLFGEVIEAYTN